MFERRYHAIIVNQQPEPVMVDNDISQFGEFEADLLAGGFVSGVPSAQCWEDRAIVEKEQCPVPEHGALTFMPYVKHGDETRYRAFAVCRRCDAGHEF